MLAQTVTEVFDTLSAAGISLALTPENGIVVSPSKLLTSDLRDTIRQHRASLVAFLAVEAANDPQAPAPVQRITTAPDWRQADATYLRHHFTCPSCCAAGQGRGDRCTTGADLWASYEAACEADQATNPKTQRRSAR